MAKAEIIKTGDQTVPQWLKEQFLGGFKSELFKNNKNSNIKLSGVSNEYRSGNGSN